MGADRLVGRARASEFVFFGQRQRCDRFEAADGAVSGKAGALELVAIEARPLEQIFDLLEIERRVGARLVRPRRRLDFGLDHRHQATPSASAV